MMQCVICISPNASQQPADQSVSTMNIIWKRFLSLLSAALAFKNASRRARPRRDEDEHFTLWFRSAELLLLLLGIHCAPQRAGRTLQGAALLSGCGDAHNDAGGEPILAHSNIATTWQLSCTPLLQCRAENVQHQRRSSWTFDAFVISCVKTHS